MFMVWVKIFWFSDFNWFWVTLLTNIYFEFYFHGYLHEIFYFQFIIWFNNLLTLFVLLCYSEKHIYDSKIFLAEEKGCFYFFFVKKFVTCKTYCTILIQTFSFRGFFELFDILMALKLLKVGTHEVKVFNYL